MAGGTPRPARRARGGAARDGREPGRTVLVTLLIGLFAVMGTVAGLDLLSRVLPVNVQAATIADRDTHEFTIRQLTWPRSWLNSETTYRLTVLDEAGRPTVLDVPRELYDTALPSRAAGDAVRIHRSVLLGRIVGIDLVSGPVVDLTELNALLGREDQQQETVRHFETFMGVPLALGGLALAALAGSLMFRLPRKREFGWPVFAAGMAAAAALGAWWWSSF